MEEWKDIEGYEGYYSVSNTGKVVRTETQRELSPDTISGGYKRVTLSVNGIVKRFTVHRLVALAFINNTNNHPQVNHKDGNTSNNCADNLEWCTASYNQFHAYEHGLQVVSKERDAKVKLDMDEVDVIRKGYANGVAVETLAILHNMNAKHISKIIRNKSRYDNSYTPPDMVKTYEPVCVVTSFTKDGLISVDKLKK